MNRNPRDAIRELAFTFLKAAHEGVAKKLGGTEQLSASFQFPSIELSGPLYGMSEDVEGEEKALVDECIRYLGVEYGSEEEVETLAWEHVWKSFSEDEGFSDLRKNARQFAERILTYKQHSYGYLTPNYVLRFTGDAESLVIGPVEAMKTECLAGSPDGGTDGKAIRERILGIDLSALVFRAGSTFDIVWSRDSVVVELPGCCWAMPTGSVKAARRNAEEYAIWMINQALSLLRLSHANLNRSGFPRTGDIEGIPIGEPKEFWPGGWRDEKGLVLSAVDKSQSPPRQTFGGISTAVRSEVSRSHCFYEIDDVVVELVNGETFRRMAEAIFAPPKNSLAERFAQGLGWQSRARQTADRAERFLFFFTAIEALLSGNKRAPVVQTISRHAATILHVNPEERAACAANLRSLYDVRSELVHEGIRKVTQSQSMEVQDITEKLYRTVMENCSLEESFEEFQRSLSQASYGSHWP